jgi:hypothetical protein
MCQICDARLTESNLAIIFRGFSRFITHSPDITTKIGIHPSRMRRIASAATSLLLIFYQIKSTSNGIAQLKDAIFVLHFTKVTIRALRPSLRTRR